MSDSRKHADIIRTLAARYGFFQCGISKAGFLEEQAPRLEQWLKQGYQGEMAYLENHFDKRLDPRLLVPGARTVVSLLYNYYPRTFQRKDTYQIAKYAYGKDYHDVVKEKCHALMDELRKQVGAVEGRVFVDSAPVMERAWAEKSGTGWIGRHGLLINRSRGSFFFLAELIIDLECEPDPPAKDHCGTCTRCVDACPTQAILPDKTLHAASCISYLTIELRNSIPESYKTQMNDWIFGCDICQDVCPWNRFSIAHAEPQFNPSEGMLDMSRADWEELTEQSFRELFRGSAVKRTGFKGLSRNIRFVSGAEPLADDENAAE